MKKSSSATPKFNEIETFVPQTQNQQLAEQLWSEGHNLILSGSPGTGKTFMALHFACRDLLSGDGYDKIVVIRSIVATRDPGHLPGDLQEKAGPFTSPYPGLIKQIFGYEESYNKMIHTKKLTFETTSFIRGMTIDNAVIIVDEMQNLNFHELDSVITRVGTNSKIFFVGDYKQSDFTNNRERDGILRFLGIVELMSSFRLVEFGWADIIRSGLVRDYIMTKEMTNMGDF